MTHYVVLLYESLEAVEQWERLSEAEIQAVIARYMAWSRQLAARGRMVATGKLRDGSGRVLRRRGGRATVTDGPFVETREVVGGYYVIAAADYDEAVQLLADCPHLDYGTIEVREIEQLPDPRAAEVAAT